MATYVLVHGSFSGGYVFRQVRDRLAAGGHEVTTPTLTGIGERVHLSGPQVRLSTHVADVVNHVLYEDLREIVLLGYSLGGMTITGALEYIADRIAHLVYLDALVPDDGESADDVNRAPARPRGIGAPWAREPLDRRAKDPLESAFLAARRVSQPLGTLTEPVHLARPLEDYPFSRTYIKATGEPRPSEGAPGAALWRIADRVRVSDAWRYYEIDTDHLIPVSRPDGLAKILIEVAG